MRVIIILAVFIILNATQVESTEKKEAFLRKSDNVEMTSKKVKENKVDLNKKSRGTKKTNWSKIKDLFM